MGAFQPKKGKQLMYTKVLNPQKKKGIWKKVPYVRAGTLTQKSRPEREHWCYSLKQIYKASEAGLLRDLLRHKILEKKQGKACPFCKKGSLGTLKYYAARQGMMYRCGKKGCQKYVVPQHGHPIFTAGYGPGHAELADQAAVLFCAVSDAKLVTAHRLTDKSHNMVEGIYRRLDKVRQVTVEREEKQIQFGRTTEWADVEGDEVDLGKKEVGADAGDAPDEVMKWEQWQGVVERGDRKTLVLSRTRPKKTKRRAPGPGPLKKSDWQPIANRYLKNRKVILHTDGAKSYRLKTTPVRGIVHDWVVHKKKKIKCSDGKTRWAKPKYVTLVEHRMPDGKVVRAIGGTQIIDRTWSYIRKHIGSRSANIGKSSFTARVRSAQWCYWHQGQDLWSETGLMLEKWFG